MLKNELKFRKIPESLLAILKEAKNDKELVDLGFEPVGYMRDLGFSGFGKYWRSFMWCKKESNIVYTVVTFDDGNSWLCFNEADIFSKRIMGVISGKRSKRPILRDLLYVQWKNFIDEIRSFKLAHQK